MHKKALEEQVSHAPQAPQLSWHRMIDELHNHSSIQHTRHSTPIHPAIQHTRHSAHPAFESSRCRFLMRSRHPGSWMRHRARWCRGREQRNRPEAWHRNQHKRSWVSVLDTAQGHPRPTAQQPHTTINDQHSVCVKTLLSFLLHLAALRAGLTCCLPATGHGGNRRTLQSSRAGDDQVSQLFKSSRA